VESGNMILDDERIDAVNEKITLIQKKAGLTFGTDAFLLASYIKKTPRLRGAELGTGTGIISLLLAAREKLSKIYAFEVQESFYDLTMRNVSQNGFDGIIIPLHKDIRDVTSNDTDGELDAVFANPPYMKTTSGKRNEADEKYIARHEVKGDIGDFCAAATRLLKYGGSFYAVWRPDRLCDIISAMRAHSLEPKDMTFVHADSETEPSMVLIRAVKGGKADLKLSAPLMLHDSPPDENGKRALGKAASRIYDTLEFDYIKR